MYKKYFFKGVNNIRSEEERIKFQTRNVEKIVVYPGRNFSDSNGEGNIALIKLTKNFDFDDKKVGSICLPEPTEDLNILAGKICTVTGWGETDPSKTI